MIPLKLQLKNFLSYGSELQEVDFTCYHLICLSGKNGHGKSALLDAMTWAIWGQARKTSGQPKPDQGLLRLGQRNMKVIFDFEFNGQHYRVRREFTFAYGKPIAYLEFGMFEAGKDELISLTDKTIRKTQAKIELLLGLDFDSFVNSAFIRQGNAGEFSHKSPKERKEILGSILGLGEYDQLRKLASEKSRLLEQERQGLLKLYEHLGQELAHKTEIEQTGLQLQEKLNHLQQTQALCELELQTAQTKQQELTVQLGRRDEDLKQLSQLEKHYTQLADQLFGLRKDWHQVLAQISGSLNRQQLENQKNALGIQLAELNLRQKQVWETKERLAICQARYQQLEHTLLTEQAQRVAQYQVELERNQTNVEHHVTVLKGARDGLDQSMQLQNQLVSNLHKYSKLSADYAIEHRKFEKRREFYQRLVVIGNLAKAQQDDLIHKQNLLEQDCPSCPVCEQNLSDARKCALIEQLAADYFRAGHRIARVATLLKNLKIIVCDQHAILTKMQSDLEQAKIWQAQLQQEQLKTTQLQKQICELQSQLSVMQVKVQQQQKLLQQYQLQGNAMLAAHPSIVALKQELIELQNVLQGWPEQEQLLRAVEENLARLNQLLLNAGSDNLINDRRVQIFNHLIELLREMRVRKRLIFEIKSRLINSKAVEIELHELKTNIVVQVQGINEIVQVRERMIQNLGSIQAQFRQLEQRQVEMLSVQKKIKQLEQNIADYKALTAAFGKEGIQALLIEDAIPEIEQEANDLLGRLTDNQAQLFIESVRDLKSGGTKETLDIKISDQAGLRPYEMFSGGEAFRIDFALRIAISKLLARRAGTALQTLIIDEGFGSQDEDGLAHIMDAIYKIQSDFAKIIIVSHLPTMKEQFPVHFYVQKGPVGSVVTILEQG